jgi:hypothetical protein
MSRDHDEYNWTILADQYREAAKNMPYGPKRDDFLRKARQLETAAKGSEWANSTGLKSPAGITPPDSNEH